MGPTVARSRTETARSHADALCCTFIFVQTVMIYLLHNSCVSNIEGNSRVKLLVHQPDRNGGNG